MERKSYETRLHRRMAHASGESADAVWPRSSRMEPGSIRNAPANGICDRRPRSRLDRCGTSEKSTRSSTRPQNSWLADAHRFQIMNYHRESSRHRQRTMQHHHRLFRSFAQCWRMSAYWFRELPRKCVGGRPAERARPLTEIGSVSYERKLEVSRAVASGGTLVNSFTRSSSAGTAHRRPQPVRIGSFR